jgi:hypothetical protein
MDESGFQPPGGVAFDDDGQILTPRGKAFADLIEISPEFARIARRFQKHGQAPAEWSDLMFVYLVMIFADPARRKIFADQIFAAIGPDVLELIKGYIEREQS